VVWQPEVKAMRENEHPTTWELIFAQTFVRSALHSCRETLQLLLEDRFGPLPEELVGRIQTCEDLECLRTAIVRSWRLQKLEDLQL
jgi:hypothetical protein